MGNVITALTSNGMIAPSSWADPNNGNDYLLTVQSENKIKDLNDVLAIPLRGVNHASPTQLDHHLQNHARKLADGNRPLQCTGGLAWTCKLRPAKEDISKVYTAVKKIVADAKFQENVTITLRGSVQGRDSSSKVSASD